MRDKDTKNPNCDHIRCRKKTGEVRILPYGGGGNLILCYDCFCHEMRFRTQANTRLAARKTGTSYEIPRWTDLKVYEGN